MDIVAHKVRHVPFVPSPNHGDAVIDPEAVVIHYTAGGGHTVDWFANPAAKVSAHFVIDREGVVTQMVPCNLRAWHAGRSEWEGRPSLNGWSVGIELENWGPCEEKNGAIRNWKGGAMDPAAVKYAQHRNGSRWMHWERYPHLQLRACFKLIFALVDVYPIKYVLGHDDVAPTRKQDPGPAFPMKIVQWVVRMKQRRKQALT